MRICAFNGDADGLCALQQLHLSEPPADILVSGPKRKITLLEEVCAAAGDEVSALDVSFEANRQAAQRLLEAGARLRYFDHHYAGALPSHPQLQAFIDPSPAACTSVIVNRYLAGEHAAWAVVGAFGDNLDETARAIAASLPYSRHAVDELRELGIVLNYNAYGESEADLHFAPAELHRRLARHRDPLCFRREDPAYIRLREGYCEDLARADDTVAYAENAHSAVYVLPCAEWARRINGVMAGRLARRAPARAHAVLVASSSGAWRVSVRAPLERPCGAAAFCREYPSGGGREGAGGINALPRAALECFARRFLDYWSASGEDYGFVAVPSTALQPKTLITIDS